ncbi:DUF2924 domain-containing protein [Cerasicoccus maritimus]|uniref:DUF2924 domain-containing protein n=1 Tax=Cerasicoccus maritimus TaxID=490089 RepID=UPI0028526FA2|nr:DUF2924 domain-containing protein [Cerasicoccus maritimus]
MKTGELINVETMTSELASMGMSDIRERFAGYYGYTPQTRNKAHLVAKILWAAQRESLGDISEAARQKAYAIADDRDVKERFPRIQQVAAPNGDESMTLSYRPEAQMTPGSVLRRQYQGRDIRVLVLEEGFEWDSRWFKSLSAIAREVTGTRWNGKLWFGLKKGGSRERS